MRRKTVTLNIPSECKTDPVTFGETFLLDPHNQPFQFHDTQKQFVRGIKPITVACCGRQWGKSYGLAAYIAWYLVTHPGREVMIVAPVLEQAKIIFNDLEKFFEIDPLKLLVDGKILHSPFPTFKLFNGSFVHCKGGNNPQNIRGHHPHLLIIDEASFVKDAVIEQTLLPMMTVTLKEKDSAIILISTPFTDGEFERMYLQAQEDETGLMAHFRFTSLDNPHRDQRILDMVLDRYGEDSTIWRTEYLAIFGDDDMAVFPSKDIKWAFEHHPETFEWPHLPIEGHRYNQGVDLANVNDYFASAIYDSTHPQLSHMVRLDHMRRRGYKHYKEIVKHNYLVYNHCKTLVDATSMGSSVTEDLFDIHAEGYVIGSAQAKYELVQELARMLNEHRLTFPNDPRIIDELRFFQYSYTKSKQLKMEAKQGHDDIVIAMAMAAVLASRPRNIAFFTGVDFTPKKPLKLPKPGEAGWVDPFAELCRLD